MHSRYDYWERRGGRRLFWGVAFIAAGCMFLLDRQGFLGRGEGRWIWPAVLALFGLMRIVTARRFEHALKGLFAIAFAAWLYACTEHLWGWTFAATWPIILIALGVKAVAGGAVSLYRQSRKEPAQ